MFELVPLDYFVLLQNFEGVALPSISFHNQKHLAVGTLPNHSDCVEVLCRHFAGLGLGGVHNVFVVFDFGLSV